MFATIVADQREGNGAIPYLEAAVSAINATRLAPNRGGNPINYVVQTITLGDYAIVIRNGKSQVVALVIERKTWKDMAASIKDTRAKTQNERMLKFQRQTHGHCLYLIEGLWNHKDDHQVQGLPFKALHSKIRHNTLRGIPFIQSRDQIHTAKVIAELARDILKMVCEHELIFPELHDETALREMYKEAYRDLRIRYQALRKTPAGAEALEEIEAEVRAGEVLPEAPEVVIEPEEEFVPKDSDLEDLGCEGGSLERAIDASEKPTILIPEVLMARSAPTDANVMEKMWRSLPGVGDKLANAFLRADFRLRDLVMAASDELEAWTKRVANVTYPNGNKLGMVRARKIMEVASHDISVEAMTRVREISRGILEAVPGISASTAQLILSHYTLKQICRGEVSKKQIAEIKRPGNRKIGVSVADKIIKYVNL